MGSTARESETTVPKKQSTAAKKARAVQRAVGGKHTVLLAEQTCGKSLDFSDSSRGCARAPHPDTQPCSENRDFDAAGWQERVNVEWATEEARRAALTDDERAEEARLAFEEEYDDGYTATDAWEDARSYKWED